MDDVEIVVPVRKPQNGEWHGPFTLEETVNFAFGQNKKLSRVRLQSFIWAAKGRACPTCPAEAFQQCLNMTDVRHAQAEARLAGQEVCDRPTYKQVAPPGSRRLAEAIRRPSRARVY